MKKISIVICTVVCTLQTSPSEARGRCDLQHYLRVSTGECLSKRYNGRFYTVRRYFKNVRRQYSYARIKPVVNTTPLMSPKIINDKPSKIKIATEAGNNEKV